MNKKPALHALCGAGQRLPPRVGWRSYIRLAQPELLTGASSQLAVNGFRSLPKPRLSASPLSCHRHVVFLRAGQEGPNLSFERVDRGRCDLAADANLRAFEHSLAQPLGEKLRVLLLSERTILVSLLYGAPRSS